MGKKNDKRRFKNDRRQNQNQKNNRNNNRNKNRNQKKKFENSVNVSRRGGSGAQDVASSYQTSRISNHPLDRARSSFIQSREWTNLYYKEWLAKKVVDIPVEDMFREGWEYKGLDEEKTKQLLNFENKIQFRDQARKAARLERLVGGAVLIMGTSEVEKDNEDTPIAVGPTTDLKFINIVPRSYITKPLLQTDPTKPDYGRPQQYYIQGGHIHTSRLIVFDGDPLVNQDIYDLTLLGNTYDGFGESVLAAIWDDIQRAVGSRQAAAQLIEMASIMLIRTDNMKDLLTSNPGRAHLNQLGDLAESISIYNAALIGEDAGIEQVAASFGSVPELVMSFLQIISAASDIPASRFLGQAPGGLNATGEGDLENYYNMIRSRQKNILEPKIKRFLEFALPTVFGEEVSVEDIEIEFNPLWNMSEKDAAEIRERDVNSTMKLYEMGIISAEQAIEELNQRDYFLSEIDAPALPPADREGKLEDALSGLTDGTGNNQQSE